MNFKQEPGIYNSETDELIISFDDAVDKHYMHLSKTPTDVFVAGTQYWGGPPYFKSPFYVIFPDYVTVIRDHMFAGSGLTGLYAKNIKKIEGGAFNGCENLEKIDLSMVQTIEDYAFYDCKKLSEINLSSAQEIGGRAFDNCDALLEKYTNKKNGLCIINDCLIHVKNRRKEIIIPDNVRVIQRCAFYKLTKAEIRMQLADKLIFPKKIKNLNRFMVHSIKKEVILPIEFNSFEYFQFSANLIYKGGDRRYKELFDKGIVPKAYEPYIQNEPYTFEELKQTSYSLEDIEYFLDRKLTFNEITDLNKQRSYPIEEIEKYLGKKLTLDELLELNYSEKEASEYFEDENLNI